MDAELTLLLIRGLSNAHNSRKALASAPASHHGMNLVKCILHLSLHTGFFHPIKNIEQKG